MKIMDLKKISRVNLLLPGAALLLAALAIAMTATGAWGKLRSKAPFLDKAQTALLTQMAAMSPSNNAFYARSYGGKCLTFSVPVRGLAFGGGKVFISDWNRTASQQIRVEELTDRPGHLVVLHAGPGVIGKQAPQVLAGPALLGVKSPISSVAEVPLEVQFYTGSAGQIFALDGDSVILAEDRNLVVEVQNNRGANGTPLVLGRRDLDDAEFWKFSATDDSNRKPTSGFARVPDDRDHRPLADQLVSAINQATPGTVIEVDPNASIELSCPQPLFIPEGVTIRGDRRGGLPGPELWTTNAPDGMFDIRNDDVRITGLRLRGPSGSAKEDNPDARGIFAYDNVARTIIDHNDLSDWTLAAIEVDAFPNGGIPSTDCYDTRDPRLRQVNLRVARNFIHHNQKPEAGYGICVNVGGYALVEGNTFVSNRHAIKGGGEANTGYRAWYNLVLSDAPMQHSWGYNWYTQDFDVHGSGYNGFGGRAGQYFDITRNTFLGTNRQNFDLRGEPCFLAEVHHNVSLQSYDEKDKDGDAIGCTSCEAGINKLSVHDNQFISPNPTKSLGLGDFDGDGKDDLFMATGAAWYYAPAGKAAWRYINAQTEKIGSLLFGDFDGDGRTDVFTTHGLDWVVSWGGASAWEKINEGGARINDLAIGDFDGDHRADVFYANGRAWYVSSGGVEPFKLFDTSSFRVSALRFGDFNLDGKTDVFGVANGDWSVTYAGMVNWSSLRPRLSDSVKDLVVADFNGDGCPDVASTNLITHDWLVSYSGTGEWETLRAAKNTPGLPPDLPPLIAAAAISRFDDKAGVDVLVWINKNNILSILSGGSDAPLVYSNHDMR